MSPHPLPHCTSYYVLVRLFTPSPHSDRPSFFFFNDTATTEIYTLSLHDALPICRSHRMAPSDWPRALRLRMTSSSSTGAIDRKSTRLNSSHQIISYAVFCLKKKKEANACGLLMTNDVNEKNASPQAKV